ncbi:hypothetical protein ASE80_16990 [Pseudomonas sp. Leaf15]|uniref:hypothetical protein n=1 Tax=unclassified Pseudomonas TaxID=196821 RepID=UPI0007035D1D|nr:MULTISPECIES: hypothetical protein [unclassified Pseudomonas]KQM46450.1 hypothetical protein ASE80_16990 [Pseudomonas sp. Leaf15]RAH01619.1 hypothetical protein DJ480_16585 [Pseudomonas sp. Leaf98]
MIDEDVQGLIVSYVAAKLAVDQESKISESKLELAKNDQATAWVELSKAGFSGKAKIGTAVALSPKDFRPLLSGGPSDSLIMINADQSKSVEVPCSKVLDRYLSRFQ